jgi:hypothetical protein
MSRRASRCSQSDIARAIRAAEQVGAVMSVEILPDGTIRLTPVEQTQQKSKNGAARQKKDIVL